MIGIIDADLIGRKKHRFPNLVCEKLSAYWKEKGYKTRLLLTYEDLDKYEEVYISKVFTDTKCPAYLYDENWLNSHPHIHVGGTGFYFDKAAPLPNEIEHHMPDYHLYDDWIKESLESAKLKSGPNFNEARYLSQFKEYLEYSIGFLTRGCFRKCGFCVNQKYSFVFPHSPIEEFYDPTRKKICLLDDNFLGCPNWKSLLESLIKIGKPFKFKQGLDERILTEEKIKMLFQSKYDGDFTFAFDNVKDYPVIETKLQLISKHRKNQGIKFYVLVGFESTDEKDIENAFKRIELLLRYKCLPYVMRYQSKDDKPYMHSKMKDMYIALARWCNQPNIIKKMSFRQFCTRCQTWSDEHRMQSSKKSKIVSTFSAMINFEKEYPEIAKKYFDVRFGS